MAATVQPRIAIPLRSSPAIRFTGIAAVLLILLATSFCFLHSYNQKYDLFHNDLIGRQFATQAVLRGADPYSPEMTRQIQALAGHDPNQGFQYPVTLAVLLAPVAWIPWTELRAGFLLATVPALFVSFWLCIRLLNLQVRRGTAAVTALFCLLSWPVIYGLRIQQPTLLAAALVLPACYLLSREHDAVAGVLLALSTFKPQLVLPLLLWLLLWSCLRRRWTLLASFAVTETLYLYCAERLVPGWFPHWLAELRRYHSLCASLPLQLVLGRWLGMTGTVVIVGWSLWRLWQIRRSAVDSPQFGQAVALLLAVAVCITPVTWAMVYDQVLLVPASLLVLFSARPSGHRMAAFTYRATQLLLFWTFASVAVAALGQALLPSPLWLWPPFLNHLLAPTLLLALLSAGMQQSPAARINFSDVFIIARQERA